MLLRSFLIFTLPGAANTSFFALFSNLHLACAWVWTLPCKLTNPLVTRTPQELLQFQILLPTVVSALTLCPSLCKRDRTQAKIILIKKKKAEEMKINSLCSLKPGILMKICLLLFRLRDSLFSFKAMVMKMFPLSFNHLENTAKIWNRREGSWAVELACST